jgi:two-component system sensor histidine kinase UhpB
MPLTNVVPTNVPPDAAAPAPAAPPLDLPRLVMKRAALVALLALLIGLVLGFARAGRDIKEETGGALALASMLSELSRAAVLGDAELGAAVDRARADGALRHLKLRIVDARGVTRLAPAAQDQDAGTWLRLLMTLQARWQGDAKAEAPLRTLAWPLARPAEASPWMLELTESREGERREAMGSLGWALLVAALASAAMLAAMAWNVRRAFAPLRLLVGRIAMLDERREPGADEPVNGARRPVAARERLPAMPIRELQVVAEAVQRLDDSLAATQAQRRELSLKVLTLQEDERARLARELHDELGQRLTALRVDLAWLARRLGADAPAREVVDAMSAQCDQLQQDLRTMLRRLRPLGPSTAAGTHAVDEAADQLPALLEPLVASWTRPRGDGPSAAGALSRGVSAPSVAPGRPTPLTARSGGRERSERGGPIWRLRFEAFDANDRPQPWPGSPPALVPGELQRTVYRMSQEAMTNVARHAHAASASLVLTLRQTPDATTLAWQVEDDGVGLADRDAAFARGSGLAGMRERAWAHGAELVIGPSVTAPAGGSEQSERGGALTRLGTAPAADDAARPGLQLGAIFVLPRAEPKPR